MANTIALAQKFMPILDEAYKLTSLTARMDRETNPDFSGANVVQIMKVSTVGLGTYSRTTGYPEGDVTVEWEAMTLAQQRARSFSIDALDNEETLGKAVGAVAGEFYRLHVAPEIDAYRFSKYAAWSGIQEVASPTTLSKTTILDALDVASEALSDNEVPEEGRFCYISNSCASFLKQALNRTWTNENNPDRRVFELDGVTYIKVPQTRFYKGITLEAGATASAAGGFSKTSPTGRDINFLMLHPSSVVQATKVDELRMFDPATNQQKRAWKIDYLLYHDAFVEDNKVKGVYSHIKAS